MNIGVASTCLINEPHPPGVGSPCMRFPPEDEAEAPQLRRGTRSPEVLLTGDVVTVLFIPVTSSPGESRRDLSADGGDVCVIHPHFRHPCNIRG